jgi:hypothetical protein
MPNFVFGATQAKWGPKPGAPTKLREKVQSKLGRQTDFLSKIADSA